VDARRGCGLQAKRFLSGDLAAEATASIKGDHMLVARAIANSSASNSSRPSPSAVMAQRSPQLVAR
jgi:hypothetical protein